MTDTNNLNKTDQLLKFAAPEFDTFKALPEFECSFPTLEESTFNKEVVSFPDLCPDETSVTFPTLAGDMKFRISFPPHLPAVNDFSNAYFKRTDDRFISDKEMREGFSERAIDDPFHEMDMRTLNRLRIEAGIIRQSNPRRAQTIEKTPTLYAQYRRPLDDCYQKSIETYVCINNKSLDWCDQLSVDLSSSTAIATGTVRVSNLQTYPISIDASTREPVSVFTADRLTYDSKDKTALGGQTIFVATDRLIYDLLSYLSPAEGTEASSVYCVFQSHPGCIGDIEVNEVYLLTKLI